ncbi:hypothetical protein AALP_AA4G059000 [Arabis alpina]|uniref:ADP-ribosyl cyclase/cyclic ADP-ribose hydrolase n=1 Tax=Arabis alpina TaxID=50452 RepID=A0A087H1E5_ARAAL|nr:hypothetical protein AALP_AA4G059000 [Arabis alpina]
MSSTSNAVVPRQPQHQVFLNFRGDEVRLHFISHLMRALMRESINVFIDNNERLGNGLENFFQRIKESSIAIAVISSRYTESKWCLDELVEIKECVEIGTMKVFPVFYKVDTDTVREQKKEFGDRLRALANQTKNSLRDSNTKRKWKEALQFVANKKGEKVDENSDEGLAIEKIVEGVKKMLGDISIEVPSARLSELGSGGNEAEPETLSDESPVFGIKTRIKQLKEKLLFESGDVTRVIGVVGMPGIGKTTLAKELFDECKCMFLNFMFLDDVRQKSKAHSLRRLQEDLLLGLQESNGTRDIKKALVVLDDVSDKRQIKGILGGREWVKNGSKIVITTSSKSAIMGMVDDTYQLHGLSDSDALRHFRHHAFSGNVEAEGNFSKLAREFVDYSRGHPSALKLLARELRNKDEIYWKDKLGTLANSPSNTIQDILRIPYDELSEQHKKVFLDIASFFRFENENYVRTLLDSSADNVSEIRDLADKFLINISGGRVEMNDLLYTFAMGLDSLATSSTNTTSERRLSNHREIIAVLKNKAEATKVRGIYLDMSEVTKKMSLDSDTFAGMDHLRYLKFFNSHCHRECEVDCKLNFPEGLEFVLPEVRYLHWLKFPLDKLPQDFNPKNLIDLKLPYSHIEQLWDGDKDTSKLQWLDLNHSSKLHSLSGLSRARTLQILNLEGCTALKTVHQVLQNMESLLFLNLRGCTSLKSLPDIILVSLRTLILSGCSSFEDFHLIAENLEKLYLDGTAITGLPSTIGNLQRLILLKLKDCKKLQSLPDSVGNLKAIQELILSGCSSLKSFPEVKKNLKHLKTLLVDGTAIEEMPDILRGDQGQTTSWSHCELCEWPRGMYGLSSVRRLSLSRNKFISLPSSLGYLYHLKWLDLKHCEKLVSVPMLPPNVQWLDAHGCISLEEISLPLDLLLAATEHLHSTFIFTNCTKLDQVVKNGIVSYARKKIQLMSDALARYEEGFVLDVLIGICFPGWRVPVWFNHRSVGSELKPKLRRHWNVGGLTGIALCAVVSFKDYQAQSSRLLVRCTCEFKEEDEPLIEFSCILGGWTEHGSYEPREIEPGHVFIGYTSWSHINRRGNIKGCVATEASLKFHVTDGTTVTNCAVVKCGFSLIYAPTDADHSLSTDMCSDVTSPTNGSGTTNVRVSYSQKSREVSNILFVAPSTDIEIIEEVTSFTASLQVEEEPKETDEKKKLVSVTNGSTSEVELGWHVDNNKGCFSFLRCLLSSWLGLGRERSIAIE